MDADFKLSDIDPKDVANEWWRLNNLYKIVDKDGQVVTFTLNPPQQRFYKNLHHRNIILKARQLGFCLDPLTPVLTADLRWLPIKDILPGTEIVAVDEYPLRKGKGGARKMRTATVVGNVTVHRKAYRITLEDGRTLVCTGKHPWLSRKVATDAKWRHIDGPGKKKLTVGSYIRSVTEPWETGDFEDGWLGGMLDGEGSMALPQASGVEANVSQREGAVWNRLCRYLIDRGYSFRIEQDDWPERESKHGKTPVPKACVSRLNELFRLIGQTRPARFLGKHFWDGKELPGKKTGYGWVKIVKIEALGEQPMIDLQTSTGTYIANGLVSHNTTFIQLWQLDRALFNPHTHVGVIAHNDKSVEAIFDKKIMFAFNRLPPDLLERLKPDTSNAKHLKLSNGSDIRVARSLRGDTLQYLHVSEYGITCYEDPGKAKEIRTGALNTVSQNNFVFIESTAKGEKGDFHNKCMIAQRVTEQYQNGTAPFTPMDYWFHFYSWFEHPDYKLEGYDDQIDIADEDEQYFDTLERDLDITLTKAQRIWYVKKRQELEEDEDEEDFQDMKQEYPATPEEAFERIIKGAIFGKQMKSANEVGHIQDLPVMRGLPVNVFWDLGRSDINAMWFHQRVGAWDHFIRYYENNQEDLTFYIEILEEYARKFGYIYGYMYLPHDGKSKGITSVAGSAADILETAGFKVRVVRRPPRKNVSIETSRQAFSHAKFHKTQCKDGLTSLRNYVFEYNEKMRTYSSTPKDNDASHGADAFQTYGYGYTAKDVAHDEAQSVRKHGAAIYEPAYSRSGGRRRPKHGNPMV